MNTLSSKAMLANLSIHAWSGNKLDKAVTAQVETLHGAKDAARVTKKLIDKTVLEPITKLTSKIREFHYTHTLPWGDNGDRLLPSKQYLSYTEKIREFQTLFDQHVYDFITAYPLQVSSAHNRLGTMWDQDDYPDVSDIRDRFNIDLNFTPVPDAADFRVDISQEAIDEIKAGLDEQINLRQATAIRDCWLRLFDTVSKIEERLSIPDAIFRDSLIENAAVLVELIPKLNIADDQTLNTICEDIKTSLLANSAATLRAAPSLREIAAKRALRIRDEIQKRLNG